MKLKKVLPLILALLMLPCAGASAAKGGGNEEKKLPIIMYHHMSPKARLCGTYTISPDSFESDLIWLKDHGYETVTVGEVIGYVKGEAKLPEKPVVICFDDAQESFLIYALPLLEKHNMCAELAVIGSCAEQFSKQPDHNLDYSYMDWAQIKSAHDSGMVEIASHTYNLHCLAPRCGCRIMSGEDCGNYKAMLTADLSLLQSLLESVGICAPKVFAYPFGSVCKEAEEVLRTLGFEAALTCDGRINRIRCGDESTLFSLGRFNRSGKAETWRFFLKIFGES